MWLSLTHSSIVLYYTHKVLCFPYDRFDDIHNTLWYIWIKFIPSPNFDMAYAYLFWKFILDQDKYIIKMSS